MTRALLIHNPVAGPRNLQRDIVNVAADFERQGWQVELQTTDGPGDARAFAQAAASAGYDVVVAGGGDGTVNEVINGLVGTQAALGVLPVGVGNLWAKQIGLPTFTLTNPMRLHEAAEAMVNGTVRPIDVGRVDGHYFLCWAGIGLDAQITTEMEPRARYTKRLGFLPYIVATITVAQDFQGFRTRVSLDGSIVRGRALLVLVSNIQRYCGVYVGSETLIDDGLLDVFVFKGLGFPYAVGHVFNVLSRRHLKDPRVVHRKARHIEVQTEWTTPVQVDGDPIGRTPVTVDVVPGALRVIVPPKAPASLFRAGL
jgi:diacylglycerol kinase (ATP)